MFILRLTGSVGTDTWGLWKGIISDCSTQIWDKKDFLEEKKKKGQGTSDLPCFSHLNLPLVWLIMCLNQSVGISRSFMQIKPHLEGAGKALTELLGISCLKEVFFFSQSKRDFLWTRKFPVSLGENQMKSCCFCFLLVTSINLAEVELDDD